MFDYWYCIQMVDVCQVGKYVYVEKLMVYLVEESELMVWVVEYYGCVVQIGQWQCSGVYWVDVVDFVQSGEFGWICQVKIWVFMDWMFVVVKFFDVLVFVGVDYDVWFGLWFECLFNENCFYFNFCWYWDYVGGLMIDWGVYFIDIVLWVMRFEVLCQVVFFGGVYVYLDSVMEMFDMQQVIYEYDDFLMVWEYVVGIGFGFFQCVYGVVFVGNNGILVVDCGKWEVYFEVFKVDCRFQGFCMEFVLMQEVKFRV